MTEKSKNEIKRNIIKKQLNNLLSIDRLHIYYVGEIQQPVLFLYHSIPVAILESQLEYTSNYNINNLALKNSYFRSMVSTLFPRIYYEIDDDFHVSRLPYMHCWYDMLESIFSESFGEEFYSKKFIGLRLLSITREITYPTMYFGKNGEHIDWGTHIN